MTLIVQRLAASTTIDIGRAPIPERLIVVQAASLIARGLEEAAHDRADEHLARIALHIEYRSDPVTLEALAGGPPVRPRLVLAAERLLSRIGVTEAGLHAPDLVTLIDSLLMQRTVYANNVNSEAIVRAYLRGIHRVHDTPGRPEGSRRGDRCSAPSCSWESGR